MNLFNSMLDTSERRCNNWPTLIEEGAAELLIVMKKNDLIKLLQELKGNPEVVLWNGYVGDYMHVKGLSEGDLVKQTFSHYSQMIEFEGKRDRNDFNYVMPASEIEELKKDYRKYINWETNDYVTLEDIKDKRYSNKRIVYIEAKLRGKSSYDRAGEMSY